MREGAQSYRCIANQQILLKTIRRSIGSLFALTSLFLANISDAADLSAAEIFTDGMVLQQQMDVPVWGNASAGDTIQVNFGGQETTATVDQAGKWMAKLSPMKASAESRTMVISSQASGSSFQVSNVLVGEVWLCAGQSNMAWTLSKLTAKPNPQSEYEPLADYLRNEIQTANDPLLRQFAVVGVASPGKEVTSIRGKSGWLAAVQGNTGDFSGTGYFFGRELRTQLGVPVGLVYSNRGGTEIEPWIPKREYLNTAEGKAFYENETAKLAPAAMKQHQAAYQKKLAVWKQQAAAAKAAGKRAPRKPSDTFNANRIPAALYNGFIHSLAPYAMQGTIWYQGESNTNYRTEHYRDSMLALINGWRSHWGQETFYFIWCQLANKHAANAEPIDQDNWAEIQNQQREVLALTDDTGMAVLNDIGEANNIHPKNKVGAGKRLALWALKQAYGQELVCSGPLYNSAHVDGIRVIVTFDHVGSGLMVGNKYLMEPTEAVQVPLQRFQIRGADKQWQWAEAKIVGADTVAVWHPNIPAPVEVRYAWSANPEGANLYNKEGLPASLFKATVE